MAQVLKFIEENNFKLSNDSKYIILYFTAHWCPPCRNFSPTLVQAMQAAGKDVDVFICSRDRDENQYKEYMESFKGFNILPFQSESVVKMMQQLGIQGIPSVQVFDRNGNFVTDEGRAIIMQNPNNFAQGVDNYLQQSKISAVDILSQQGIKFPEETKYVGLYFTASWCPPCQQFSPVLIDTVKKINDKQANTLSVVILSCDEEQDEYKLCVEKYENKPNFHIVPHQAEYMNQLAQKFKIQSIPSVIILNKQTGALITRDGRTHIQDDKENATKNWN